MQLALPAAERKLGKGVIYPMIRQQIWTSIALNFGLTFR